MKIKIVFLVASLFLVSCKGTGKKAVGIDEKEDVLPASTTVLAQSITRGKAIYIDMCVTCHLPNGKGVPNIYPPLANSDYLLEKQAESISAIKYGLQGEVVVNGVSYNQVMAPLGLENDEVADVMNYISNTWGNQGGALITEAQVANIKQ